MSLPDARQQLGPHGGGAAQARGPVVAVVPLKAVSGSKSRLRGLLSAPAREELTGWMLSRVLAACRASTAVDEVLVVAGDQAAAGQAAAEGVAVLVQPRPGLAAALATADRAVTGSAASLVVVADVPLARGEDLDAVWAASRRRPGPGQLGGSETAADAPCVAVTPTWDGGTAVLLRRPPTVVGTAFGPASAAAHEHATAAAGVRAIRVNRARLSLDVDTPAALRALAAVEPEARWWLEK